MALYAYVILGDLVDSRVVRDRPTVADDLERAIKQLGARYGREDAWVAPLVSTQGMDAVSGVLRKPRYAFDIAVALNTMLWPYRFRFALGSGTIDVAWKSNNAAAMDGPAFHRASDGLERARRDELTFAVELPEPSKEVCRLVERLCRLHQVLMQRWSKRAAMTMRAYRHLEAQGEATNTKVTQGKAARELGITQQAISEALTRAHYAELTAAEDAVRTWLGKISEASE